MATVESKSRATSDPARRAEVLERMKSESLKSLVPDRPGHDRRYLLDSSKLRGELGWSPEVEFEAGLGETVEWYRTRREWWEPLKQRAPVQETAWR